jgi:hypothetical protein
MILSDIDHLSIWEIAHRWYACDPNISNPEGLPLQVQDILRLITVMQCRQELPVLKVSGVELKSERTFCDFENFQFEPDLKTELGGNYDELTEEKIEQLSLTIRKDAYFEALDHWSEPHMQATEGLERCFKGREFNKEKLESIHLDRLAIQEFCQKKNMELPGFWFSEQEIKQFNETGTTYQCIKDNRGAGQKNTAEEFWLASRLDQGTIDRFWDRLSNSQKHRLMTREVAIALWKARPQLTQAEIISNEVIRNYCGAAYYSDPNTVRSWIKDLDPRPPENRRGRPSSK